jgi:hypothetical protein
MVRSRYGHVHASNTKELLNKTAFFVDFAIFFRTIDGLLRYGSLGYGMVWYGALKFGNFLAIKMKCHLEPLSIKERPTLKPEHIKIQERLLENVHFTKIKEKLYIRPII